MKICKLKEDNYEENLLFLTVLVYFILTSIGSAGEIKVYDANDQFLGILLDSSVYATTVFIPSLGVVTEITNHRSGGSGATRILGSTEMASNSAAPIKWFFRTLVVRARRTLMLDIRH